MVTITITLYVYFLVLHNSAYSIIKTVLNALLLLYPKYIQYKIMVYKILLVSCYTTEMNFDPL